MAVYDKKMTTIWSFLDEEEEQRNPQSPTHPLPPNKPKSTDQSQPSLSSSGGCASPWTFSPLNRLISPSLIPPSLLYHCLATLHRRDGNLLSLAVSNTLIFTGSDSDRVRLWRHPDYFTDNGAHIRTGHGKIRAMLAHDTTLFTAHKDHRVRVWTVSSPPRLRSKKLATLPARAPLLSFSKSRTSSSHRHEDAITCLALYLKEGLLYTGSLDRTVRAWRPTGCVDCFVAHDGVVNAMAVGQEDGCLFTGSSDGSVKVWRRVYGDYSHAVVMVLRFQSSPVNALAIGSSSSCFLYSGSSDGYVNVWEKEEAGYRHGGVLQGHRFGVLCLAATGKVVVSGSEDTTIRVWRREECGVHACVVVMEGHRGPVRCVAVCVEVEGREREGLLVYSASLDGMVKVWKMKVVGKEKEKEEEVVAEMSPVLSPLWVEKKRVEQGRVWY